MTESGETQVNSLRPWMLTLAHSALLLLAAASLLVWMLRSLVPIHASLFEGMGVDLPPSTRVAIAMSVWTGRLLRPGIVLGVVGTVPALRLAHLVGRRLGWTPARMLAMLAGFGAAVALALVFACGFVVWALRAGFISAVNDPRIEENMRVLQEYRQNQEAEPRATGAPSPRP
jgi:hypothetical protein